MRRAFHLLTMFLLLNLTLGSGELVCEKHGPEGAAHPTEMAGHHHGQPDHSGQGGHRHQSGEAPIPAPCCPAMASCGLTAIAAETDCVNALGLHDATPESVARALLSRMIAPETPPPRV